MNRQLQDPLDWQLSVNRTLATESPDRFGRKGILSEQEMKEAEKARTSGLSGEEFALQIAERDRQLKGVPLEFPRPLSDEHERIIELLRDHYEHTGRPLVLCESEHYITFRIPKITRPSFKGAQ